MSRQHHSSVPPGTRSVFLAPKVSEVQEAPVSVREDLEHLETLRRLLGVWREATRILIEASRQQDEADRVSQEACKRCSEARAAEKEAMEAVADAVRASVGGSA